MTNHKLGLLSTDKMTIISRVCDEIISGKLDNQFPLVTGNQIATPTEIALNKQTHKINHET